MSTENQPTITDLEIARREARANMLAAWNSQTQTTVDEGFSYDQAWAAQQQALAAAARYYETCNALEAAYAHPDPAYMPNIPLDEDRELEPDYAPLGGW